MDEALGLEKRPSVDDLAEENPSFLKPFRLKARGALEDRLEDLGVDQARTRIEDHELEQARAWLRTERAKMVRGKKGKSKFDRRRKRYKYLR